MELCTDYMSAILEDPGTSSYRILAGKKTVGLLHLTFLRTDGQKEETVYLMGLGVLPKFRRSGFAKAALWTVFSRLPEHSRLTLQVSTSNVAAFRLYEKMGLQISSRLDYFSVTQTLPGTTQKTGIS